MTIKKAAPFNPLDKKHLGESVGQAMLRQPAVPLAGLRPFEGAGIYAIYYSGRFPAYKTIADRNIGNRFEAPIYIGRSVPKGARKGNALDNTPGRYLYSRLVQHARGIDEVDNLNLADFHCRYLIVDDIWIPLGEALLIAKFNPLWNKLIEGFGNHNPGKGRHAGLLPRWDTIHPGRAWGEKCQARLETAEQIIREAKEYLRNNPPPEDPNQITGQ